MDDYRAVVADFSPAIADFFPVIPDSPPSSPISPVIADFPRHSRFLPVIPARSPRHSRESGNPEGGGQPSRPEPSAGRNIVIPIKTGTANPIPDDRLAWAKRLVRIRIYGIIGFSGFYRLVFNRQALIRIRLGEISDCGEKRKPDESKS